MSKDVIFRMFYGCHFLDVRGCYSQDVLWMLTFGCSGCSPQDVLRIPLKIILRMSKDVILKISSGYPQNVLDMCVVRDMMIIFARFRNWKRTSISIFVSAVRAAASLSLSSLSLYLSFSASLPSFSLFLPPPPWYTFVFRAGRAATMKGRRGHRARNSPSSEQLESR